METRFNREKRDFLRQIAKCVAKILRILPNSKTRSLEKRDLVRRLAAEMAVFEFKDETHARELEIKHDFDAHECSQDVAWIIEYRTDQAEALAKKKKRTLVFPNYLLHTPSL